MLTKEERAELEALKKDPYTKMAIREQSKKQRADKEKKKLYQYRWLKKRGEKLAKEQEERGKKNAK